MAISTDTLNTLATRRTKLAHVPWATGRGGPRLDLEPLPADEPWLSFDEDQEIQLELKQRYLMGPGPDDCFRAMPDTDEEQMEVWSLISSYLCEQFPDGDFYWGAVYHERLRGISAAVQDDLCIMQDDKLVAASVCFPTSWTLDEKMGEDTVGVHKDISTEKFQRGIAKKLAKLEPGQIMCRANWFVYACPHLRHDFPNRLYERTTLEDRAGLDKHNAGDLLYVRSERQTVRRLPETGAILFTIRIYVDPLRYVRQAGVQVTSDFIDAYAIHKQRGPWVRPMMEFLCS